MARESHSALAARLEKIISRLKETYPQAHCELNYRNPLELLVATILSAQANDKQVNLVTEALFKKYRTAADYANADPVEFADAIKRIGLYRNKAKNIQAAARKLIECHHGEVPASMEELIELDGVGRKTANVVLGNAFNTNCGVVVDTRDPALASPRSNPRNPAGKNRASAHETGAPIRMDSVQPSPDLAWTPPLLRPQSRLPKLRNEKTLPAHRPAQVNWSLLHSGPGGFAFNMALDAALLEAAPALGRPVLRFYSWTEPAASFGYFQKYSEVERMTLLRPLVRRPTAGGLVPHDSDWTYSLAFPPSDAWYALKAVESYQRVHEWLRSAFAKLGIVTELADCCRKALPGQCFVGHEKSDVLWRGQKIAGAAQRRTRNGLLIQGSVQPPPIPLARADWEQAFLAAAQSDFGVSWLDHQLDEPLQRRASELAAKTYSQSAHNRRR